MKYILGAYSQLSFGSSDEEFEHVLNSQIKPILTYLYNNPSSKLLLRLSMAEFEWFDIKHPEINMLIKDLCIKGQIELLSSCYYDSVIGLIPNHERSLHIERTTTALRKRFSKKPHGLWINYQIFNPSVIPVMELSSLNYIVMSTYNQATNSVLFNKPFCMREIGKNTLIFPMDDKFSSLISDSIKLDYKLEKTKEEIKKLFKSSGNQLNTYMLNLDLMASNPITNQLIPYIYSTAGSSSLLPSNYLEDHEVSKYYYIPSGIYGRDFNIGKSITLNQHIFDNNLFNKYFDNISFCREEIKNVKKSSVSKDVLDELLYETSNVSLFIPMHENNIGYRKHISKKICEIEKILILENLLSQNTLRGISKNLLSNFSVRGGSVKKLSYLNSLYDITYNSDQGLFYENIRSNREAKVTNISNKNYEFKVLDKKNNDFEAKCSEIQFENSVIDITKTYKLRQNSLMVYYSIKNVGKTDINNYSLESLFNFSLDKDPYLQLNSNHSEGFTVNNMVDKVSISVAFSELLPLWYKSLIGNNGDYQYTQFRVQKNINLKSGEVANFSISLKIDRFKEKNNDIK